jgi:hypothetical protein
MTRFSLEMPNLSLVNHKNDKETKKVITCLLHEMFFSCSKNDNSTHESSKSQRHRQTETLFQYVQI